MKKLTLEDYSKLKELSMCAHYEEYNSNVVTMFMWDHYYEIFYELHEHYALILVKYPNRYAWLMPLCEEKYLKEAFYCMEEYSREHHFVYEVHGMNQQVKEYCEKHDIPFVYEQDRDAQDYVYDIQMHKTLSGKKMQKRRNHFNAFMKEYGNRFEYRSLTKNDREIVFEFLNEWKKDYENIDSIEIEIEGISHLFDLYDELNLKGGCIFIDHQLKGFNLYSELSERMLQMHVDKVDKNIRGISVALLKYTLQECDEKYTLLNREDDMGLDYLRKAKKDMVPVFKVKKYTAIQGQTHITKASNHDLNAIKQLWSASFSDEDEFSTAFYFNHLYDSNHTYLLKYEDEIISMMQIRFMNIMKEDKPIKAGLVFGVATNQKYQGCGYMKQLLNAVLNEYREPFILIQAYNWDLYRSFGFSEAYTYKQSYFESQGDFDGELCTNATHLLELYQDYVSNKDGYRIRDLKYYEDFYIPYYTPYCEIYANENAYIVVDKKHSLVSECIYRNTESLISLLNRFEKILVNADIAFGNYEVCNMLMAKGDFKRNDALFIHDSL